MNYCACGRNQIQIRYYTALLLRQFFARVIETYTIQVLCDLCGKEILDGYRNTYGIGV